MSESIVDQLREKFLPEFLGTTRGRLERMRELLMAEECKKAALIRRQFHELGGEASMLGLMELANFAFRGEDAAQAWERQGPSDAFEVCSASLEAISQTIDILSAEFGTSRESIG